MTSRHHYRLTITSTRPTTEEASTRQLRSLLKVLLRSLGFRCVSVERMTDKETNQ